MMLSAVIIWSCKLGKGKVVNPLNLEINVNNTE